jgi:hypothetical protein
MKESKLQTNIQLREYCLKSSHLDRPDWTEGCKKLLLEPFPSSQEGLFVSIGRVLDPRPALAIIIPSLHQLLWNGFTFTLLACAVFTALVVIMIDRRSPKPEKRRTGRQQNPTHASRLHEDVTVNAATTSETDSEIAPDAYSDNATLVGVDSSTEEDHLGDTGHVLPGSEHTRTDSTDLPTTSVDSTATPNSPGHHTSVTALSGIGIMQPLHYLGQKLSRSFKPIDQATLQSSQPTNVEPHAPGKTIIQQPTASLEPTPTKTENPLPLPASRLRATQVSTRDEVLFKKQKPEMRETQVQKFVQSKAPPTIRASCPPVTMDLPNSETAKTSSSPSRPKARRDRGTSSRTKSSASKESGSTGKALMTLWADDIDGDMEPSAQPYHAILIEHHKPQVSDRSEPTRIPNPDFFSGFSSTSFSRSSTPSVQSSANPFSPKNIFSQWYCCRCQCGNHGYLRQPFCRSCTHVQCGDCMAG